MCADREAAAALTRRGLAVFPLPPGGRRPAAGSWQHTASADATVVAAHWPAGANIGVACRASRIVGLDLDLPDGIAEFAALCVRHGQDPPRTFTVATPSGGRHLYLRVEGGCTLARAPRNLRAVGIDLRGPGRHSGGYLIGPGSIMGGTRYAVVCAAPIAVLPGWLAAVLE
ncbi:bifunctional DNA primase/polymerase [Streptomyces sp. NPDC001205]